MAKITEEEARAKSDAKVEQIKDLADKLQIRIVAEQAIVKGHLIRNVVYFLDQEEYDIEGPKIVERGPLARPNEANDMKVHVGKLEKSNDTPSVPQ